VSTIAQPSPAAPPSAVVEEHETLAGNVREWVAGLRSGELGSLPIVVGIVIIAIYFQSRNSHFLTAGNMVNLITQMAAICVIGMGIVFVLLLGEIDLSVGQVSGVGGVIVALLLEPSRGWDTALAIAMGLGAGLTIGLLQGMLFAWVGIPSFVVTLAGLLGWGGVVLTLIGGEGTVVIQNSFVNGLANNTMNKTWAWVVVEGLVALYALMTLWGVRKRKKIGLPARAGSVLALRIAGLAVAGAVVVYVVNQDRGVPYVGVLMLALLIFWTFVATRTRFGRYVYAVGGNAEAARRAGINVSRIKILVFGISGLMAALGGLILASRLSSVDTNTGSGSILLYSIAAPVIGGTSLFGGRGNVKSALLGAIVIAGIDNGLGLLNVSAGTRLIVTALVLLAAVTVDSIARRGRASAGRA
jgi:D-xylose transport system permease protein